MNVEILLDPSLYPVESILGAAYVFTERCYVLLDRTPDGKVKVLLTAKAGAEEAFPATAGEFQNELLAQRLRRLVGDRHEKVRETIVARALFGAAPELVASPPDDAQLGIDPRDVPASGDDFLEDPLGIAVPWEEKYGAAATAPPPVPGAVPTRPPESEK